MYQIINEIDGKQYLLYDVRDKNLTVLEPRLTLTLNKTGVLEFKMPSEHRNYSTIRKLRSSIRVYEDKALIFEGRAISDEADFYNTKKIVCEGCLAYFQDSVQRPFSVEDKSVEEFLEWILDAHNEQVEERKQFVLGRVNVAGEVDEGPRQNKAINNTWNVLKAQLLDVYGGVLWIEYADEKKVLNYTWDYGGYNEQEIRFGVNLLDLSKYQDATQIITRLIPTGGEEEYQDELGETQKRTVDITSVNGGKDYLDADPTAIEEFGLITATLNWPKVTDPAVLLAKAKAYLKESIEIPDTLKISAVDLNYAGIDIQRFCVGYYTKVTSRPHNLKKEMLLTQLDIYLDNPKKGSISLGGQQTTFTGSTVNKQTSISKAVEKVAEDAAEEINRRVENATQLITGGFGGYVVLDSIDPKTGKKMHPWRILVMNTPDKETATNVIQINQNGIGFSRTGIDGPYRNAWTIDGNLVADFITAGTMLADRIRGGTLEVGGTGLGKDGKIMVKDANDKVIGYWDKTGLHILLGVITGSEISGSNIIGGTINIGSGTFEVNEDGAVTINAGEIDIGNIFYAGDGRIVMGDFRISSDGRNIFQAVDGSIKLQTAKGGPLGEYPVLTIKDEASESMLTSSALKTSLVNCKTVFLETAEWNEKPYNGNVGEILDYIWNDENYGISYLGHEVRSLQSQIDDLWDSIAAR